MFLDSLRWATYQAYCHGLFTKISEMTSDTLSSTDLSDIVDADVDLFLLPYHIRMSKNVP